MDNLVKTVVYLPEKVFAGISLEIPQQNSETSSQIGALWGRFFSDNVPNKIDEKLSESLYGVYTNVVINGDKISYKLTTAVEVSQNINSSQSFDIIRFPAQKYLKFTTPYGPMPDVCAQAWYSIWNYFSSPNSQHKRAFTGSFELYDQRAKDPLNTQLDILISII